MDALLMFSGGIDSTLAAYEYLKNNPDKKLLMHHVILKNKQKRDEKEKCATIAICDWFRRNGLNNFKITYSVFDYGHINYLIWDIEIMAFHTYIHLCNPDYQSISHVLLPFYLNRNINGKYQKFYSIISLIPQYRQIKFDYLYAHKTKKEIIDRLPSELLQLTWYCRKPINDQPCKHCYTCKEVQAALS